MTARENRAGFTSASLVGVRTGKLTELRDSVLFERGGVRLQGDATDEEAPKAAIGSGNDSAVSQRASRVREVERLLSDVRMRGDEALREQSLRFDGARLASIEVARSAWDEAWERVPADVLDALKRAARNIETFHRALLPPQVSVEPEPGVRLERRFAPLQCAGLYVPGGTAAYPSSVLMAAIPARVAGVPRILVATPAQPDGRPHASVLAACRLAGVDRVFAMGGAGAIGAFAYGTESVPRADVIVGPGNAWVEEAKQQVATSVRIDSPAGPSEVLVLADATTPPDWAARELIAQAEHDPSAVVVLVSTDAQLIEDVATILPALTEESPRADILRSALSSSGALLLADSREEMARFAEDFAAEHLFIGTSDAEEFAEKITAAGTIFVGAPSSVVFGDYLTGANHVLPTSGMARNYSSLSTETFLRSYTVQTLSNESAAELAKDTSRLAEYEGLPGHAEAARARGGDAR